jgi:hypothetical protein
MQQLRAVVDLDQRAMPVSQYTESVGYLDQTAPVRPLEDRVVKVQTTLVAGP